MKLSIKNTALLFVALFGTMNLVQAQSETDTATHLRNQEVQSFNRVQIHHDADVIFIKSDRNRVSLVGDSAYVFNFDIVEDGNTLGIYNYGNESDKLSMVVIEYKELESLTASGHGKFYLHNLKEDRLNLFNPEAEVIATGYVKNIRVISQEGKTDLRKLDYVEGITHVGTTAQLLNGNVITASATAPK